MKRYPALAFVIPLIVFLSACSQNTLLLQPSFDETPVSPEENLVRSDEQGAVAITVTPVNLGLPGETLIFEITLDTHSVDLNLDLGPLATLITDTGISVGAIAWDAPRGGHHVAGQLLFPAHVDGLSLIERAKTLTLVITDVEATVRTFTWDLSR